MPKTREPRRLATQTLTDNGPPVDTTNTGPLDRAGLPQFGSIDANPPQTNVLLRPELQNGGVTPTELAQELADSCFVAGTLVHTKERLKPIEEIRVGDWVMSQPEDSNMLNRSRRPKEGYTYRQVTRTFVHDPQPILEVTYFQPGRDSVIAPLRVTANHPIWSKGHGWIPAGEMKFGHTLAIGYFGNVIVGKVRRAAEIARVYNIEVDEFHTYFVGELGVWVHNKHSQTFGNTVETPKHG